jgi:hypothetical protein
MSDPDNYPSYKAQGLPMNFTKGKVDIPLFDLQFRLFDFSKENPLIKRLDTYLNIGALFPTDYYLDQAKSHMLACPFTNFQVPSDNLGGR